METEQPLTTANHTALWFGAGALALGTVLLTRYIFHRQHVLAERRAGELTGDKIAGPFGMLHRPPEEGLRTH